LKQRDRIGAGIGLVLALLVGACSAGSSNTALPSADGALPNPIIVLAYSDDQNQMLANVYAGALTAASLSAEISGPVKRRAALEDLEAGEAGLVLDTIGSLTKSLTKSSPDDAVSQGDSAISSDLDTAMNMLRDLAEVVDLAVPDPAGASNAPVVAIAEQAAKGEKVSNLSQLGTLSQSEKLTLGGLPSCDQGSRCSDRWKSGYGLEAASYKVTGSGGKTRSGIEDGDFLAGVLTESAGTLAQRGLVVLQDNEQITPVDNFVPVVSRQVGREPVTSVLNRVSGRLTSQALRDLNDAVDSGIGSSAVIADAWLAINGLA
jgi:osmoprotectant transport system substrate-binding protein